MLLAGCVAADDLDPLDRRVRKAVADLARGGLHVRCRANPNRPQRIATRQAPANLTPTERQIAQIAADGLTNKGIAARMFVSAKTVEANLSRVYRKLGISARTQLGRALAKAQE